MSELPPMHFDIDPALLGPAVTDSILGVTFRPPAFFQAVGPERLREIQENVREGLQAGDSMAVMPVRVFGRPGGVALLTLSRFVNPPPGGIDGPWLDFLRRETRRRVAPATVEDDLYRLNGVPTAQFLVQNPSMVLFRLVLQGPGPAPVQVDFVLPRTEYEGAVRAVESSIGSIQMFPPAEAGRRL